ncbi:hypothetical protein ACH4XT_11555 [Streptomyces avidinii]|uniref:hypothetical protein n=1 Tax=Streptomyces avidinii TaxID=1895 RepID=UPI0037907D4E
MLDELGARSEVDWASAIVDAASVHTRGGSLTEPNPVDRGKKSSSKAHFSVERLSWLRERGLVARIAQPGIESGQRLGPHRWKIERSIAWLFGYRRLTVRYERKGSLAPPRLPRPGRRPDLLPEALETCRVRHPLGFFSNLWH